MKKMLFTLVTMLTIAVSANAMSYERARSEALFLTDKMAYELNLTDAQYEAAYEINLDYLMGVSSRYDVFGTYWDRRNIDMEYILYSWQWDLYRAANYFYRPLYWEAGHWHFGVYIHYPHRDYFYFGRPHFYASYRGGHSWRSNGGHSYYSNHHDHYRPAVSRDAHFGMKNGWDRGDYRNRTHGGSSTRYTAGTGSREDHHSNTHTTGNRETRSQNVGELNNGSRRTSTPSRSSISTSRSSVSSTHSSSPSTSSTRSSMNSSRPSSTTRSVSPSMGSSRSSSRSSVSSMSSSTRSSAGSRSSSRSSSSSSSSSSRGSRR